MQITCPYCHSSNVTTSTDANSILEKLCSPSTLSGLGASICTYYKVNPALGAAAGTALATAISSTRNRAMQPPLIVVDAKRPRYFCHTCTKTFTL